MVESTALAVAAVVSVIGAGVGTYAAIQQGQAADDAAKYNAKVAENNAIAQQQQAEVEAGRIRDRNRRLMATQKTSYLKSGVDLGGSAADVIYDTQIQGEMDRLTALYTGQIGANASHAQANLSRLEGSNARTGSYYRAAGTILGGLGSGASLYGQSSAAKMRAS